MTTAPPLRWGLLGSARVCRRGLIPGIRASRSGTLWVLASRDRATARVWVNEFAVPRAYASYQGMLDDPEVDVVSIPLPNELHRPWDVAADAAARRGAGGRASGLSPLSERDRADDFTFEISNSRFGISEVEI
jgi:predicted dehydrogenase